MRVGTGWDAHRFEAGRPLILGGVPFPGEDGLAGHSDADVVCHALIDAVLGAAAAGDCGTLFPDTEPALAGADSLELLRRAVAHVAGQGFHVVNADVVVVAERPRLSPRRDAMCARLADALGVGPDRVSVKGTTSEGMGFPGRGEGIASQAVVLLRGPGE